jgi:hypothetical protein
MLFFVFAWAYTLSGNTAIYNQIRYLLWTGGSPHIAWTFTSTGNAGTILFESRPTDPGYSGAHLFIPALWEQVLSGSFWSETVGWIDLQDVKFTLTDSVNNIWTLSGYAWSDRAGWFDFGWVTYQLSNTSFSGYAWNDGIGWIDMSEASIELTSLGAIGKVKIIGKAWSNRIFNIYDTKWAISATTTSIINDVRKNVSILKRNLPSHKINTALDGNRVFDHGGWLESINGAIFFENTSSTPARVQYQRLAGTIDTQRRIVNVWWSYDPVYTVIAIGADIHLNDSVKPQSDSKPRVFIALKNSAGVGGNIYIDGAITQIYSSMIAEGSIYSGEFSGTTPVYYNDSIAELFKIPNRQLYVYGTIISNNTIGGYRLDNGIGNTCPYNITPCTDNTALLYDFNHFRDFHPTAIDGALLRAYQPLWEALQDTYDDYSMIIEHDFRIIDTPPPWLDNIQ